MKRVVIVLAPFLLISGFLPARAHDGGAFSIAVGPNINIMAGADPVETQSSCNPGKQTAQNETTIAVNPDDPTNLVAGANDYRLFNPTSDRYDASGGVYRSTDGGASWTVDLLPGLIRSNEAMPGPYEVAGDPSVAAGPDGVFWYANIAFERAGLENALAVSRSSDGGATWTTRFVVEDDDGTLHDKEWIAAHPTDPNSAYLVWARYSVGFPIVVVSSTRDGGLTWSEPTVLGEGQGASITVDDLGWVHVTYGTPGVGSPGIIIYAVSRDGAATFAQRPLATVIGSTQASAGFRIPWSVTRISADGPRLHFVYASLWGTTTDVLYMRSPDRGLQWRPPRSISTADHDQFFAWIDADGDRVFASWYSLLEQDTVSYWAAGSHDGGETWSEPVQISPAFDVARTNRFGPPGCELFLGDYTGVAVGRDGVGHLIWSDGRIGNSGPDEADLDPYTATVTF